MPTATRSPLAREIRDRYPDDYYVQYHAARYARVIELARASFQPGAALPGSLAVLDVGRSRLTGLLAEHLHCRVDTMGFDPDQDTPTGRHFQYNLNDAHDTQRWRRGLPTYHLIVFAEVIEHLHTSPVQVLSFLRTLLRAEGVLLLQTPNAAAIHKRLMLLAGRHPYDPLSPNPLTPGHIREYTMSELAGASRAAGFSVASSELSGYFDYRFRFDRRTGAHRPTPRFAWMNTLYGVMPRSLRRGITMRLVASG